MMNDLAFRILITIIIVVVVLFFVFLIFSWYPNKVLRFQNFISHKLVDDCFMLGVWCGYYGSLIICYWHLCE